MRTATEDDVAEVIESVVREHFADAEIPSVTVEPDTGSNGDPLLRVTIVFDGPDAKTTLRTERMISLVRHIRPKLWDLNDDRFPLVSFVSKLDAASRR